MDKKKSIIIIQDLGLSVASHNVGSRYYGLFLENFLYLEISFYFKLNFLFFKEKVQDIGGQPIP
jgi:hypothetical protein